MSTIRSITLTLLSITFILNNSKGQNSADNVDVAPSAIIKNEAEYNVPTDVQLMLNSYQAYHQKHPQIPGYRIEIFSSSGANSKLKARNARLRFTSEHDSIPAYVVWEYPNFEVRVGDFRTKLDAEAALVDIVKEFPFAFITKDQIELPTLIAPKVEE